MNEEKRGKMMINSENAKSPILKEIKEVYVCVKDLKQAVGFYGNIFGLKPTKEIGNTGSYCMEMESGGKLTLTTSLRKDTPMCSVPTRDIRSALEFLTNRGIEVSYCSESSLTVVDPNGHHIEICKESNNESEKTSPTISRGVICRDVISSIFVPVESMDKTIKWYSGMFGLPTEQTSHEGTIYGVHMAGATGMMLDANWYDSNHLNQINLMFETQDIHSSYEHITNDGIEIVQPIEDIGSVIIFAFCDSDHNVSILCQKK
jgi:predicted enzyme related to lactoylglutathione lyase